MGRKRKHADLGLPPRVYLKHGAFYYVHPDTGRWERIGTDIAEAKKRGNLYADPDGKYGTLAYWLDRYLVDCKSRIGLPKKRRGISQRTYDDYCDNAEPLKVFFGGMLPEQVDANHVADYLDAGARADRAVRANREKACLSTFFTWALRKRETGVKINPCFGVKRNPERKRERYVEHHEYDVVYRRAAPAVQMAMDLEYRTLQRPEDMILWGPANVVRKRESDGSVRRVLRTTQGKTSATVDILITAEIDAVIERADPPGAGLGPGMTFLHTRKGHPYTYSGLSSMFRRYVDAAVKAGELAEPFTFYDIKGKGATDMWLANVPLTAIQVLCGHDSVTTTEKYVKSRWRGTVEPNRQELKAG